MIFSSDEGQYRWSALGLGTGQLVITSLPQSQEEAIGIESREVVSTRRPWSPQSLAGKSSAPVSLLEPSIPGFFGQALLPFDPCAP
jgi:hypothetical protein